MKVQLFLAVFTVVVAASVVLASPVYLQNENGTNTTHVNPKSKSRVRRDMMGVFDAICNGVEAVATGVKTVSRSVAEAFNNIFSTSNANALTDGFTTFGRNIKGAFDGLFGPEGGMTTGFKKIGDKISGAFKDDNNSGSNTGPSKGGTPDGGVPDTETT